MRRWRVKAIIVATSLLGGCAKEGTSAVDVATEPQLDILLWISTSQLANDGRSLRMLVREVEPAAFEIEQYDSLVGLAVKHDETVIADRFLRPESDVGLRLRHAPEASIGAYFFFGNPRRDEWKILIESERDVAAIEVGRRSARRRW